MDPKVKLLYFLMDLVMPLVVGYLAKRRGWFDEAFSNKVMMGNLLTVMPILSALSIWTIQLNWQILWLPVMGVVMQMVPWAWGYWRVKQRFTDPLEKGAYLLSCMLSNRGVVGILTVFVLYGEVGYALSMMVMLFARFIVQMVGFPLSEYYAQKSRSGRGERIAWWHLIFTLKQVPMIGIILGIIINLWGIDRPPSLGGVFQVLIHVMAWGFVMPIGYGLDFSEMRQYWRRLLDLLGIKFVLTPLVIWLLVLPLPLEPVAKDTILILAFSPTAINAVITAKLHGLNTHLALAAFMLTTVVYMVLLLPLFLLIFG